MPMVIKRGMNKLVKEWGEEHSLLTIFNCVILDRHHIRLSHRIVHFEPPILLYGRVANRGGPQSMIFILEKGSVGGNQPS
jgi:hypothetical protein